MCSLIGTTKNISRLSYVNRYTSLRGPDLTNAITHGPFTLVHNLLSITGDITPQPFVSNELAALFNGEIYNFRTFGNYQSDGEVLLPLYRQYGASFTQKLDGEFAILLVDLKEDRFLVSTDVFGTKPLWIARSKNGELGVASYQSALLRLDFKSPERVPSNTTRVYKISNGELVHEQPVRTFNLEQFSDSYDACLTAFSASVKKRSDGVRKKIFLGLSSGYDSGAIACELKNLGVQFKVFSIAGKENDAVLQRRLALHEPHEFFDLSHREFLTAKEHLIRKAEDSYLDIIPERGRGHYVVDDDGAVGLSAICARARRQGYLVLFSGQGADEIFADYGHKGKKFAAHSSFGGLFPEDLKSLFPWRSFYGGTQRAYLDKEESVAGSHGIETRYPFLDVALVQAFLNLKPELKNRHYKAPLHVYLKKHNYPMSLEQKVGFVTEKFSRREKMLPRALYIRFLWWLVRVQRDLRINF